MNFFSRLCVSVHLFLEARGFWFSLVLVGVPATGLILTACGMLTWGLPILIIPICVMVIGGFGAYFTSKHQ
jgi:hypothetical protein